MATVLDRLGIITDEVCPGMIDALDWIAANGLKHVEIRTVDGKNVSAIDDATAKWVRDAVESRGLFVSAVASPLFKCALDPSRPVASGDRFGQAEEGVEAHFAKLDRVIAIAKLLKTRLIRIFSFWREVDPLAHRAEVVRHLTRAAQVAAKADVLLLLENEPSCNGGYAQEIGDLVRAVNHPSMRALWDPGNDAYSGHPPFPEGYGQLKDVVAHVHLKDAYIAADGKPRCVPMGSGNVPVIPHLKALAADGYKGLFTIETHYVPQGSSQKTGTAMTLQAIRTLCNEV